MTASVLYDDGNHKCIAFTDLVQGEAIRSNQFLVVDAGDSMLLDPGGNPTCKDLLAEVARFAPPFRTRYVFASHEDPDIIASANGWLLISDAKIVIAQEWARFLPHFCLKGMTEGRVLSVPRRGMNLDLGTCELKIIPAHFLHAVGNFQVYDPVSRILFSGDLGASLIDETRVGPMVADFDHHLRSGHSGLFRRRYMTNNKVCRFWANMVRNLEIDCIAPQHGGFLTERSLVNRFIDWVEGLECGTDLASEADFAIP